MQAAHSLSLKVPGNWYSRMCEPIKTEISSPSRGTWRRASCSSTARTRTRWLCSVTDRTRHLYEARSTSTRIPPLLHRRSSWRLLVAQQTRQTCCHRLARTSRASFPRTFYRRSNCIICLMSGMYVPFLCSSLHRSLIIIEKYVFRLLVDFY